MVHFKELLCVHIGYATNSLFGECTIRSFGRRDHCLVGLKAIVSLQSYATINSLVVRQALYVIWMETSTKVFVEVEW